VLLRAFQEASSTLRQLDPYWCWAVTDDRTCATSHDGVVATPAQYFPGGTNLGFYGPAHIREIASSPDILRDVFSNVLRIQLRGDTPTPPVPPPGQPGPWSLTAGQQLTPETEIRSANGVYALRYQSDGNLVIYSPDGPIWSTDTAGQSAGVVEMHGDGNLVIYNAGGEAIWASGTNGFEGSYTNIQDDGHLVIFDPTNVPIWWSGGER
jgi:hypothetical protein